MTQRRPLVLVNGRPAELPIGDTTPGANSSTYVHEQLAALDTWTVTHNLDKYPAASVVDSGGTQVFGGVQYISRNQLIITFSAAFSGRAFLN